MLNSYTFQFQILMFFEIYKNINSLKITHHTVLTCKFLSFVLLILSSFSTADLNVYDHTTLKAPVLI